MSARPEHTAVELTPMIHDSITLPEKNRGDAQRVMPLPHIDDTFSKRSPEEIEASIQEIDAALKELRTSLDAIQTMDDMPCFFKQPAWASYVGGIVAVIIGGAAIVFEALSFSIPTSPIVIAAVAILLITVGILLSKVDRYRKALDPFQRVKKLYDVIDKIVTLQMLGLKQLHTGLGELRQSLQTLDQENKEFKANNNTLTEENKKFEANNNQLNIVLGDLQRKYEATKETLEKIDGVQDSSKAILDHSIEVQEKNKNLTQQLSDLQSKMTTSLQDLDEMIVELREYQERKRAVQTLVQTEEKLPSFSERLDQIIQSTSDDMQTLSELKTFIDTLKENLDPSKPEAHDKEHEEKMTLRATHLKELAELCKDPEGGAYGMDAT